MSQRPYFSRGILDVESANLDSRKVYEVVLVPPVPATAKVTSITARCMVPFGSHVQPVFAMNGTLHLLKVTDPYRQKTLKKDQIITLNLVLPRREFLTLTVMNKVPQGLLTEGKLEIIYSYHFLYTKHAAAHTPIATVADVARNAVRDAALKRSHQVITNPNIVMSPKITIAAEQAAQDAVKQAKRTGMRM
jgi:hypothetical protein